MPEWIIALKAAVGSHNVAAFLDGRLALADSNIVKMKVVRGEQRAFATKLGVSYKFHVFMSFVLFPVAKLHKNKEKSRIRFTDKTKRFTERG